MTKSADLTTHKIAQNSESSRRSILFLRIAFPVPLQYGTNPVPSR
jgi:hypothetical protein